MIDIFIRSYVKDFKWLQYCLKSVYKYCSGYDNVVLVVPERDLLDLRDMGLTKEIIYTCENYHNDYVGQMLTKMRAFQYTTSDYVLYLDSDSVFTKPTHLNEYFIDNKPILYKTKYDYLIKHSNASARWQQSTEMFYDEKVIFEYMRGQPFIYKRIDLEDFYSIFQKRIESLVDFMQTFPNYKTDCFSEFNIIGQFMDKCHPTNYNTIELTTNSMLEPYKNVRQFWSWGGMTKEVMKELEQFDLL